MFFSTKASIFATIHLQIKQHKMTNSIATSAPVKGNWNSQKDKRKAKFPTLTDVRKKILLVDEDKDFCILMKKLLINENVDFIIAHTLKEGMFLLEKENPEFIFLDNILPDGSGWEKTEYILQTYPQTQLNLLSGFNVPKTSASTFRILEKPLMLNELLSCLAV